MSSAAQRAGKCTAEDLQRLWSLLVKALLNGLEHPPPGGPKATFLEVVRAFLKDNKMISENSPSGATPGGLAEMLRELERRGPNNADG